MCIKTDVSFYTLDISSLTKITFIHMFNSIRPFVIHYFDYRLDQPLDCLAVK